MVSFPTAHTIAAGIVQAMTAPIRTTPRGLPGHSARPADVTPEEVRWLAWHEARSHALIGRDVQDLGDAVLLHDESDREPFWNRMAGIAWPANPAAFDRRLTEALALFAGLDRIPHVWPMPGFDEPLDLTARLLANGFEDWFASTTRPPRPVEPDADATRRKTADDRVFRGSFGGDLHERAASRRAWLARTGRTG